MFISHKITGEYAETLGLEDQTREVEITDPTIIKNILEESAELKLRSSKSKPIEYFITLLNDKGEKMVIYMGDDIIGIDNKYYRIISDNKLLKAINNQHLEWDTRYH